MGSDPRAFLGLMDSTHLAGLAPNSQGMASLTNRENRGVMSDTTTYGMTGGGRTSPPTGMKMGRGRTGSGGYVLLPPHNYRRRSWDLREGPRDPDGDRGQDALAQGDQWSQSPPPN